MATRQEAARQMGRKWGTIAGRANRELQRGIFAPNFDRSAAASVGGKIGGKTAVERGTLHPLTLEDASAGGKIGGIAATHIRWHVQRQRYQPRCPLCREGKI
jgi:hypothetical protein